MKLFSILSTTTMALLLAAGCSSTTTNQTDGGTETGTVTDTGTAGGDTGTTADTGGGGTDSGAVPCADCQKVKCATQMTACQEGSTAAACVSQYNTWGNCVKACASADADQTACINKCNEAVMDPAATDLVTCVLDCASTCTQ